MARFDHSIGARMKPGDRVTIVHAPSPEKISTTLGEVIAPVIGGHTLAPVREDGCVAIHMLNSAPDAWLWVSPMLIDAGNLIINHHLHRSNDPDTARLAAAHAAENLTEHCWLVLESLVKAGQAGLIDHQHQHRNGLVQTSAGVRRKHLERLGLCEPTGEKRKTGTGSWAAAHRVTARGIVVWQVHDQGAA